MDAAVSTVTVSVAFVDFFVLCQYCSSHCSFVCVPWSWTIYLLAWYLDCHHSNGKQFQADLNIPLARHSFIQVVFLSPCLAIVFLTRFDRWLMECVFFSNCDSQCLFPGIVLLSLYRLGGHQYYYYQRLGICGLTFSTPAHVHVFQGVVDRDDG